MPTPADAGNRELEAAIDGLYQGPLDQFTSERNLLAASLKKNGDKMSAERVKALAKPSSTAWAVNQAWWHHRERFQAMLDAGAAQRKAHIAFAQGRPTDVRAAGEARRQAVSEVTEAALQALGGHKAVAPDVQYRIGGTVEALASSGVPEGESPGRLTRDLQSSGLDALTALAEAAGSITRPTIVARGTPAESTPPRAPAVAHRKETPAAPRGTRPEPAATESARERKTREAQEAAERTRAGQLTEARTRASQSGAALEAATQAASESAAAESSARAALEAAAKRRVDLEAALDEARAEEAAARRALSSATAAASRAELDRARADRDAARAREALERLEAGN
jgi:hypothetical protein